MNIIVSCRASEVDSIISFFREERIPTPTAVCTAESTADFVTRHVRAAVDGCRSNNNDGDGETTRASVLDIVAVGVDDVMLDNFFLNSLSRHVVCAFLPGGAAVAVSLVVFPTPHDARQRSVDITAKLFTEAVGDGGVHIYSVSEYDRIIELLTKSPSFRHIFPVSSLLLRLCSQREQAACVVNLWWLQTSHVQLFFSTDGLLGARRLLPRVVVFPVRDTNELQLRLASIGFIHAAKGSPDAQLQWPVVKQRETEMLKAELQAVRDEFESTHTTFQQQKSRNEALESTILRLREEVRGLAREQGRLENECSAARHLREQLEEDMRQQVNLLNEMEGRRVAHLRRQLEWELKMERGRVESHCAHLARIQEEENRRTLMHREALDREISAAREQKERLLGIVSRKRRDTSLRAVFGTSRSTSTKETSLVRANTSDVEVSSHSYEDSELCRVNEQCEILSRLCAALSVERDELANFEQSWAVGVEEDEVRDSGDDDGFESGIRLKSEDVRRMARDTLEREEHVTREALCAIEEARRAELNWDWVVCAQSLSRASLFVSGEGSRPPYIAREQQRRELTLCELERVGRLKAAVQREMQRIHLEGAVRERSVRQLVDQLRVVSERLVQERNACAEAMASEKKAAEAEAEALRHTLQLLHSCKNIHLPLSGSFSSTGPGVNWHTLSHAITALGRRVQREADLL
ncbi:Trichohyalin, putative [Trypanosoma cruzi marinkellei]|uniref:Trichohyalin, putative n=1 Tax=Trypanosoma cruzi marinkellei TaxID=85056 RepID=K2NL90_TRYCR|nr:Trichohyalin, putative [Trypanosoma cruzi marinkellei]